LERGKRALERKRNRRRVYLNCKTVLDKILSGGKEGDAKKKRGRVHFGMSQGLRGNPAEKRGGG